MDKLTIFFDLDDTLYDRRIPYERAFYQFFGGAYTEKLPQAFNAVIHRGYEVFTAAHTGRITMEAMHIYRHQTGLADVGISITPDEALRFQALYAEQQRHITLSDTMCRVLDVCKNRFAAVGVITNGGVASQTGKLKSLGMERWAAVPLILISDAVGVMKPAPEIFHMEASAKGRRRRPVPVCGRFLLTGYRRSHCLRLEDGLDESALRKAGARLPGLHRHD